MFEPIVYSNRRNELRATLRKGLILFLGNSASPINYPSNTYKFRQDSNFLYYFGIDKPDLVGIIDLEGGRDTIYGNDFSMDDIIWMGDQPKLAELAQKANVASTRPLKEVAIDITQAIHAGRPIHFLPPYRAEHLLTLSKWLGIMPHSLENYVSR